jgi:hypothetical protein
MMYAQVAGGQKLHLVYEAGEGPSVDKLIPKGHVGFPLCGRPIGSGYRMIINLPLANACKNCQRIYAARAQQ